MEFNQLAVLARIVIGVRHPEGGAPEHDAPTAVEQVCSTRFERPLDILTNSDSGKKPVAIRRPAVRLYWPG